MIIKLWMYLKNLFKVIDSNNITHVRIDLKDPKNIKLYSRTLDNTLYVYFQ